MSYIFYKHLQTRKKSKSDPNQTGMTLLTDPLLTSRYDGSGMYTSGSGQGPQNLAQRTISKQVTQQHLIGSGRFGQVYKG